MKHPRRDHADQVLRDAGALAGASPNTVAHWVARRDAGELTSPPLAVAS